MAVMSVALFISNHLFGVSYNDPTFSATFLPTYYILVPFSLAAYIKYRKPLSDHQPRYLLFLCSFIPLVLMSLFTVSQTFGLSKAFFLPLIDAFFVGISEELIYRGVVFTRITEEKGLFKGILFSAIAFSIAHSVNVIGGVSLSGMLHQLFSTFVAGLFFALVYHYTKNIYLLIIFHSLWDYILFTDIPTRFPWVAYGYLALTVLEFVLVAVLFFIYRKEKRLTT